VNKFARLMPYVWPSRHKLFVSFGFAALVAMLWGGNLATVFPIVKVLLEGESLQQYVQREMKDASGERDYYETEVRALDAQLAQATEADRLELMQKKVRLESKIASVSTIVARFQWVSVYLLPWMPEDQFDTFAMILGGFMVMTLLKLAACFVEEILVGSVVQLTIMRIRKALFRKVLSLDYQTLTRKGTPDLMSRFTYDVETLAQGLNLLAGKIVREPLKAAACIAGAFWVNWRLTLLCVLFVPLALVVFHRIGRLLKKASHRGMEAMARIYRVLEETFDSLKIVIAFNGGPRQRLKHHLENKAYYQKSMSFTVIDSLTSPITELMGLTAVTIAMLPGAYLVLRETNSLWGIRLSASQLDVSELCLLYALLAGVLDPVRKLSSIFSKLKRSSAAADRLFELLDAKSLVEETISPQPLPERFSTITFDEVRFTYASDHRHGRPAALANVSLKVQRGEVIAVVGENGSGKSTLVNLLPRYFDVDDGRVLLDSVDICDATLESLRSRIGVVTQETLLFDDTIYENIRFGRPEATRAEIEEAAQRAHVTAFVNDLPDGFETRLGERGGALSGGQRQRIAVARAMLRDPQILILDEATSAIDAQSELLIHQTLREFVKGRTTFIITHSVTNSVLELATRMVVMERGRLIAAGPHQELIESCPEYRKLYMVQATQHAA
jgi:ATP-binding cassette, subfamily B, bacterial MsbA